MVIHIDRCVSSVENRMNKIGIMMEVCLAPALFIPISSSLNNCPLSSLFNPSAIVWIVMFLTTFVLIPIASISILVIVDGVVSKLRV